VSQGLAKASHSMPCKQPQNKISVSSSYNIALWAANPKSTSPLEAIRATGHKMKGLKQGLMGKLSSKKKSSEKFIFDRVQKYKIILKISA
jgi:hypothetical protein